MLKAKINLLKAIDFDPKTKYWIYWGRFRIWIVTTGNSVFVCILSMYKHSKRKARSTSLDKSNPDPENLNMMHTRVGAIKSEIFQILVRRQSESRDQKDLF